MLPGANALVLVRDRLGEIRSSLEDKLELMRIRGIRHVSAHDLVRDMLYV